MKYYNVPFLLEIIMFVKHLKVASNRLMFNGHKSTDVDRLITKFILGKEG
jgi:hypothetical protein